MQSTIHQRRHLDCDSLRHTEPIKTDECVGDVITTSQVENEPCCGILDRLETLDVSERQVNQETVGIVQPAGCQSVFEQSHVLCNPMHMYYGATEIRSRMEDAFVHMDLLLLPLLFVHNDFENISLKGTLQFTNGCRIGSGIRYSPAL